MGGPVFNDNSGDGRWGHGRGVMGEQAGRDDAVKVGVSREGVHIQLSCPNCSMVFVADTEEAKRVSSYDPDDMRAESVIISWDEVKGMIAGKIHNARLQRSSSGYALVELCPQCSRHYVKRGLPIDPQGLPPQVARDAMQRRREVSAVRPLPISSLMRWLDTGRRAGVVV